MTSVMSKNNPSSPSSYSSKEACPICLEPMSKSDLDHPLLCSKKCGYNFCVTCIEHLIKSSDSDVEEASDGNMAVKIRLQCPQCRSDLRISIHDTLLLRKVDSMQTVLTSSDSMLTASELRMKHSWDEDKVKDAVEVAQRREEGFLNNTSEDVSDQEDSKCSESKNITTSAAAAAAAATATSIAKTHPDLFVDVALFRGMQYAMTMEEQHFVTTLMTSGDTARLAQAAEILKSIGVMSRQGVTPSMRSDTTSAAPPTPPPPPRRTTTNLTSTRRSYVYRTSNIPTPSSPAIAAANKKERMKQARISAFNKLHPLPQRMPLFCSIPTKDFIINRARTYPILFKHEQLPQNRVIVTQVKAPCNKYGICRGDVITHINGEPMETRSPDDLMTNILLSCSADDIGFTIVINADQETAEKLQLRASLLQAFTSDD